MQDVFCGEVEIRKVKSDENLADALTKALDAKGIRKHVEGIGAEIRNDRHSLARR